MKYLLPLLLLNTACGMVNPDYQTGGTKVPRQVREIDPSVLYAVRSFEGTYGITTNYPIVVGNLDLGVAGLCEAWTNGARRITIDRNYMSYASRIQIEQVVWHELGHCTFNREHDNALTIFSWSKYQYPKSLMNEHSFNQSQAEAFMRERTYYAKELEGK